MPYVSSYSFAPNATPPASKGINPFLQKQGQSFPKDQADKGSNQSEQAQGNSQGADRASISAYGLKRLSEEEQRMVQELQKRDKEVKAHEQAHMSAGGRYVRGGASYKYQKGPDGKNYAVGGEVSIDTSEEQDPESTIKKMEVVIRAALAPSNPSAQDRKVAAEAQAKKMKAVAELAAEKRLEEQDKNSGEPRDNIKQKHENYSFPGRFLNIYI